MAKLLIKNGGLCSQVIDLRLGANRLGRAPTNDFQIDHPTVSGTHCEILLEGGQVMARDCGSTNGTRLDGQVITEAVLAPGQVLALGDVEMVVESVDVNMAIPKFATLQSAPPVVLADGSLACKSHPQSVVTHRCTHCGELLCESCVHRLRRKGGQTHRLCPICSHEVERIGGEKKKKRTFLSFLQKTVKLPFLRAHRSRD